MSVSRVRAVRRYKRKQLSKVLKVVVCPPVIAGKLLFDFSRKKRRRKK